MKKAVLLVGFGGPERAEDIRPFLANVLRGRPVPPHRVEEVARQYERIGGRSPYNALVGELTDALKRRLSAKGDVRALWVGMRNWNPDLKKAFRAMKADGVTDVTAVALAAYRSIPSFHYYLKSTAEALHAEGGGPRVRWVRPWWNEERFAAAVADRVREAAATIPGPAKWVFTAHSIPVGWDRAAGYADQIRRVAERAARALGQTDWTLVFQSRSGRPEDPWLEPDVAEFLSRPPTDGTKNVLVIPVGFLMDHVEVLFDLDVKAREAAEAAGWTFHRAKTVGTHPLFIDLLSDLILDGAPTPVAAPGPRPGTARRLLVVGGGIAGLSAAHHAREQARQRGENIDVRVWDAGSRPGGVIETGRRDGILWEGGPDSFITEKPAALALARRLGMENDVIGTNRRFQQSFVARGGRLHPTPEGFYLLAPTKLGPLFRTRLLSWPGKARAALEFFLPPRRGGGDETLASFVRRRFGREVLDQLAQPMVAGIYSADPEELSLRATFPRFLDMEARGGVIRSLLAARRKAPVVPAGTSGPRYGLFATFRHGVGSFVDRLVAALGPDVVRCGRRVARLERNSAGWTAVDPTGAADAVDAVILACAAPAAGALLRPTDARLASLLTSVPYGAVATVNVAVRRERLRHPLDGFGFVVPANEKRVVTGCTFSSVKFDGRAPEGWALLRAFVGGPVLAEPDDRLLDAVRRDLRDFLGVEREEWMELRRYPGAMPHYTLGHEERVAEIFERANALPGLALCGNGYRGIGLPDCVAGGEEAVRRALRTANAVKEESFA